MVDGRRPEGPAITRVGNVIAAWPTKLAFAPLLAEILVAEIQTAGVARGDGDPGPLREWPHPGFGVPPWERGLSWS